MGSMPDGSRLRHCIFFIIIAAVLIAVDQLTKRLAVSYLSSGDSIVLIEGVLEFYYVENRGAAFGILYGRHWLFVVLAAAVSIFAFTYYCMLPGGRRMFPLRGILICIVAGALGNCIDRLRFGYVIDFIYFRLIDFPVFNFADILVTCSAFLIVLLVLFYYKDEDLEALPFIGKSGQDGNDD